MITFFDEDEVYRHAEVQPQQEVIHSRRADFPELTRKQALTIFRHAPVEFEIEHHGQAPKRVSAEECHTLLDGENFDETETTVRLIISTPDKNSLTKEHPVMTTEEMKWVRDSAYMIANALENSNGKVFIAGGGLLLLNRELEKYGVFHHVVAELNDDVAETVEHYAATHNDKLELRRGDFQHVLEQAIERGETFSAISIDAFPLTAEEVNRDASSNKVLDLALQALEPGGVLTCYPDSRYLPYRIIDALLQRGIPHSSMHYTVSSFEQSDFTQEYHYGSLMSVIQIQKPLISNPQEVANMLNDYWSTRSTAMERIIDMVSSSETEADTSNDASRLPLPSSQSAQHKRTRGSRLTERSVSSGEDVEMVA